MGFVGGAVGISVGTLGSAVGGSEGVLGGVLLKCRLRGRISGNFHRNFCGRGCGSVCGRCCQFGCIVTYICFECERKRTHWVKRFNQHTSRGRHTNPAQMDGSNLLSLQLDTNYLPTPTRGHRRRQEPLVLDEGAIPFSSSLPRLIHPTSTPTHSYIGFSLAMYPYHDTIITHYRPNGSIITVIIGPLLL